MNILAIDGTATKVSTVAAKKAAAPINIFSTAVKSGEGCHSCALNDAEGLIKIRGIKQLDEERPVMVWLPNPTLADNESGKLATGIIGRFIWQELERAGIPRESCNIQSTVRCCPSDVVSAEVRRERPATNKEVSACRYWSFKAISKTKETTKVHIVFGKAAGVALLGRAYKKDTPIFWHEELQATVVCVDHPSYFIKGAPEERLKQFRQKLVTASQSLERKSRWAYLEAQDYKLVITEKEMTEAAHEISTAKKRVSVDVEYGLVGGDVKMLVVGFSTKPGMARVCVLDHPESTATPRDRKRVGLIVNRLLSDPAIKKTMHYGVSDTDAIRSLLGVKVKSFERDTMYASYLKNPSWKSHSLETQANERVQEFVGYKKMIEPFIKEADGSVNYARIPLKVMRLYNGADCDLTIRVDRLTEDVNGPLAKTYLNASFVTTRMERTGPWLDRKYFEKVNEIIPKKLALLKRRLVKISGNKNLNPNSPQQIKHVLYHTLEFPIVDSKGKEATDELTLKLLETYPNGKFCTYLMEYRSLSKMVSTYLNNYENSANVHNGRLRTKWWLAGTITGRLRSGGSKKASEGIVNMQNLHGEPLLKNLLVSDEHWRLVKKLLAYDCVAAVPKKLWDKLGDLQVFISADYAQIEIRILAQMARDPLLIKHCMSEDLHSLVGSTLTGWSVQTIKDDEQARTTVKGIHFGIIYGLTAENLYIKLKSEGVKVKKSFVTKLYKAYFERYNKVARLIKYLRAFAEKNHYVETMFGFRRPIISDDSDRGTFWGNQAINSPIQGSAHQLMLFAMALIYLKPKSLKYLQNPVMEVHDAFVFFSKLKDIGKTNTSMLQLLETEVLKYVKKNYDIDFLVPLKAEAKVGLRYGVQSKYFGGDWKQFIFDYARTNEKQTQAIQDKWFSNAA